MKKIIYDGTNMKEVQEQKHRILVKRSVEQKFKTIIACQKLVKVLK